MTNRIFDHFFRLFIIMSILYCVVAIIVIAQDSTKDYNEIIKENPIEHYYETDLGYRLHQCVFPIYYMINDDISVYLRPVIQNAFEYWNAHSEQPIFKFVGLTDKYVDNPIGYGKGLVIVDIDYENNKEYYAYVDFGLVAWAGCMASSGVHISPWTLELPDTIVASVMRHEIGHIVGLRHNFIENSLMYPEMDDDMCFLLDMNDVEFRAFKVFY